MIKNKITKKNLKLKTWKRTSLLSEWRVLYARLSLSLVQSYHELLATFFYILHLSVLSGQVQKKKWIKECGWLYWLCKHSASQTSQVTQQQAIQPASPFATFGAAADDDDDDHMLKLPDCALALLLICITTAALCQLSRSYP